MRTTLFDFMIPFIHSEITDGVVRPPLPGKFSPGMKLETGGSMTTPLQFTET